MTIQLVKDEPPPPPPPPPIPPQPRYVGEGPIDNDFTFMKDVGDLTKSFGRLIKDGWDGEDTRAMNVIAMVLGIIVVATTWKLHEMGGWTYIGSLALMVVKFIGIILGTWAIGWISFALIRIAGFFVGMLVDFFFGAKE